MKCGITLAIRPAFDTSRTPAKITPDVTKNARFESLLTKISISIIIMFRTFSHIVEGEYQEEHEQEHEHDDV